MGHAGVPVPKAYPLVSRGRPEKARIHLRHHRGGLSAPISAWCTTGRIRAQPRGARTGSGGAFLKKGIVQVRGNYDYHWGRRPKVQLVHWSGGLGIARWPHARNRAFRIHAESYDRITKTLDTSARRAAGKRAAVCADDKNAPSLRHALKRMTGEVQSLLPRRS